MFSDKVLAAINDPHCWQRPLYRILLLLALPCLAMRETHAASCTDTTLLENARLARVQEVADGDTLVVAGGERVRLIGINTPERERGADHPFGAALDQPFAPQAQKRLVALSGKEVLLVYGQQQRDRYQRLLAHPFTLAGENITAELLQDGYGFAVAIAPNLRFTDCYFAAEKHARASGKGVWSEDFFAPLDVTALLTKKPRGGFLFARGEIASVRASRRAVWVDFHGQLTVMIGHLHMPLFYDTSSWTGKQAIVRGWIIDRGENTKPWHKRWMMAISHPSMVSLEE